MSEDSKWLKAIAWMSRVGRELPTLVLPTIPEQEAEWFWIEIARVEMATRDALSAKIRRLVNGLEPCAMTALEAWFYRRRAEWAGQLALVNAQEGIEPESELPGVLDWLLIESWESDGCIAFWHQAERGGKPHPDNSHGWASW